MVWLDGNSYFSGEDINYTIDPVFEDHPSARFFPLWDHGALPDFYQTGVDAAGVPMFTPVPAYDMIVYRMPKAFSALPGGTVRMFNGFPMPPITVSAPPVDRSGENVNGIEAIPAPPLYPYLAPPPTPMPPPVIRQPPPATYVEPPRR